MSGLYDELTSPGKLDAYPFHMPGHKRNPDCMGGAFPVEMDITEITDFDNLHHPEGIILEAMKSAAELYGAENTYFSVNGSTAALLSAISAAVRPGEKILTARNCHKAVYHALYLRNLEPVYVYPEKEESLGISGGIFPEKVDKLLSEDPGIRAVVITSPTYDGVVSDVRSAAEAAHRHDVPLIVDEAHGAHFVFSDYFPESAVTLGADLVIHSVHKTLPSLTQTALLHRCSERVSKERLERFLSVYQSSSPSYILMASIDSCMQKLRRDGREMFRKYTELLSKTRKELFRNQKLRLISPAASEKNGIFDFDRSKILLSSGIRSFSGNELFRSLRYDFGIEPEMTAVNYVLLLSSVGDTKDGFERLTAAAAEIEKRELQKEAKSLASGEKVMKNISRNEAPEDLYQPMKKVMRISEAMEMDYGYSPLEKSAGLISGGFVFLYPPGIPVIVPGEEITEAFVRNIKDCLEKGLNVQGLEENEIPRIRVIG